MFGVLLNGATICTYDLRTRGPRRLRRLGAIEQQVTIGWFVPSTLRSIADSPQPGAHGDRCAA